MIENWQSITALAIVVATAAIFILRAFKRRKQKPGCGGGCGCPLKPK